MSTQGIILQGGLLGLSSGLTCLTSCAPILLPVMAGGGTRRHPALLLAEFLSGRLAGYLLFAVLAWLGNQWLLKSGQTHPSVRGFLDLCLASLLLVYSYRQGRSGPSSQGTTRGCVISPWRLQHWLRSERSLIPVTLGLASGLTLCPPFVTALAKAGLSGSLPSAMLFFGAFFCATSAFFLPLPLLGPAFRHRAAAQVARFSCILVALYLAYSGICELLPVLLQT